MKLIILSLLIVLFASCSRTKRVNENSKLLEAEFEEMIHKDKEFRVDGKTNMKRATGQDESNQVGVWERSCGSGEIDGCYMWGIEELEKGNCKKGRLLLKKACDGGQVKGCRNMWRFCKGQQFSKAKELYEYVFDGGTEEWKVFREKSDNKKQGIFFKKLCDRRNLWGCYVFGAHEASYGSHVNVRELYKRACDGGVIEGCVAQGDYELANSNNLVKAQQLYKKACNGGAMSGCTKLGDMELDKSNWDRARKWYKKACEGGELKGCTQFGIIGYGASNPVKAMRLYKRACDGGYMNGCFQLGRVEFDKGNLEKAVELNKKACEGGEILGCDTFQVEDGRRMGDQYLNIACDRGVNEACRTLVYLNRI